MSQKMIIVIAPSGGGKSTFLNRILEERSDFEPIVTYTSRKKREGEKEGEAYHFVEREAFLSLKEKNFFVETAEVHGRLYGTPRDQIESIWEKGHHVILDVDVQGADALKAAYGQAYTLFILPPSINELRRRVTQREGRAPDDLEIRMANAEKEIARAAEFDGRLVNDDIEVAYKEFKKMIEEYLKSP